MTPDRGQSTMLIWLLPSVRDIVFICLFWSLLAGPLSTRPLADVDIGWHIRNGERILATQTIPRTDPFSSTMQGQPWFAWEWLYDVLLGALHHAGGLNAVVWLAALVISLALTLVMWWLIKNGAGLPLAILLMILAEGAASIHMFARPHIASWLFTLVWFFALEEWQARSEAGQPSRWLSWLFPLSMLLWVNLHGGWVFGLALMAIYVLGALIASFRETDPFKRIRSSALATNMAKSWLVAAAATVVNPYGWRLHTHIYAYLSDRYLMDKIVEFRSPDFHSGPQRFFAVILVIVVATLATSRMRLRLTHLLVLLLAVYAGLFATRNLPTSAFLLVLIIGPVLWDNLCALADRASAMKALRKFAASLRDFSHRIGQQELSLRGHVWAVAAGALGLAACLQSGTLAGRPIVHVQFDAKHLPVVAIDYLAREGKQTPVFCPDQWSGLAIYRLYPQRLMVIDDRHDLYGSKRFQQYLVLIQGEPAWREVLNGWNIQTAMLPPKGTLANLLRELPQEWKEVYADDVAVIFEKQ